MKPSKKCSQSSMTSRPRATAARIEAAMPSRFSSGVVPSATRTCSSQALATKTTASHRASKSAAIPGSLAADRPARLVMPKAASLASRTGGSAKKAVSSGLAPG